MAEEYTLGQQLCQYALIFFQFHNDRPSLLFTRASFDANQIDRCSRQILDPAAWHTRLGHRLSIECYRENGCSHGPERGLRPYMVSSWIQNP